MAVSTALEKSAERIVAGACALIVKQNNADASKLVQMFLDDARVDGFETRQAVEALARGGIIVALMAAEPNVEENINRVISVLGAAHE